MKKQRAVSVVILLVALLVLGACAGPQPGESEPTVYETEGSYQMVNLDWIPANPPRPGLRCWVAMWTLPTNVITAVAVSYCEED